MQRLAAILLLLVYAIPGMTHEVRPGYLEITETTPDRYAVLWKVPMKGDAVLRISPILPEACTEQTPPSSRDVAAAVIKQWTVVCAGATWGETSGQRDGVHPVSPDVGTTEFSDAMRADQTIRLHF